MENEILLKEQGKIKRLTDKTFNLDPRIGEGFFSANYFLKTLSNQVYGIIEARQNGEYLKEKFNEDQDFVEDILLQQFIFWEDSDVDILQSHIKGIAPAVERQLRDRGLLFEGVIRHYES